MPTGTVHLLASHPTPPVFDGPEDRNGARHDDEIRLWREYISPGDKPWLCDDAGRCGGLDADRSEEHQSELQSLMRSSYAGLGLNKNTTENSHDESSHCRS